MKVLLNIMKSVRRVFVDTLVIWFLTNFIGSTIVCIYTRFSWADAFFFSMLFSTPVFLPALGNYYILFSISNRTWRILYGFLSVMMLYALLLAALSHLLVGWFHFAELIQLTAPYALTAVIIFFTVSGKQILKQDPIQIPTP